MGDTFSEMLARPGLTSEQVKLCRDIRRHGKNKVAAQNCRKRKLDTIEELQSQVGQVQRRKAQLLREREQLEAERARWSSKLSYLEETVLAGWQELWHVHLGGDRERRRGDQQDELEACWPSCCSCWWSREATAGRQEQRLRPLSLGSDKETKARLAVFSRTGGYPCTHKIHPSRETSRSIALTQYSIHSAHYIN